MIKKWIQPAILVVIVPVIVVVAMSYQDLKTDYDIHKCTEKERDEKMIICIEKLRVSIDSLRYEIKFINFKNGLEDGKRINRFNSPEPGSR